MPCEILINGEDKNFTSKGDFKDVRDLPISWGAKVVKPAFVFIRVINATASEVQQYMASWYKVFTYTILAENEQGYRIKVEVDPGAVSVSGVNKDLRTEMKTYVANTYGGQVFSFETYEAVVDVPKPLEMNGVATTLADMKADIDDKFMDEFLHRRYYFSEVDVDDLLTKPDGRVELTKAEVLVSVKDRLED